MIESQEEIELMKLYELGKKQLQAECLSPEEYEVKIKELALKLGV